MVNFISHHQERANVKVRWPNKELIAHKPDWLKKSPEVLKDTLEKIGMSFEYVATRDIKAGEVIVVDDVALKRSSIPITSDSLLEIEKVLGRTLKVDVKKNTPILRGQV